MVYQLMHLGANLPILPAFPRSARWPCAGKLIASVSQRSVRIWNLDDASNLILDTPNAWAENLAWAPDDSRLASGGCDGTVQIWRPDGTREKVMQGNSHWIDDLAWSPDGGLLASAGHDNKIVLWNTDTYEPVATTILFANSESATIDARGAVLYAQPETVERELVYLIEQPNGAIKVLSPSELPERPRGDQYAAAVAAADLNRRAAEWVLSVDGIIKIRIGEEEFHLRQGEALPTGPFRLIGVFFTEGGRNEHPTWINDDSLRNLDGLTDLEMLRLSDTEVTDAGLTHLGQFKKLEWLELWGTEMTDAGLEHLQVLQNLTLLTLNDTQVTDAGLQHLAVLTQLKTLHLRCNGGISDAGIKHLVGLKRVEHLSLGKANITDAGLNDLSQITSLTRLGLDGTKVTSAGVAKLQGLLPKCEIIWDGK